MKEMNSKMVVRKASDGKYGGNGIRLSTKNGKLYFERTYLKDNEEMTGMGGCYLTEEECLTIYGVIGRIIESGSKASKKQPTSKKESKKARKSKK